MSALRKVHEQQVAGGLWFIKLLKVFGWGIVGLGVQLCLTLIGIPVGIMLLMLGAMCIVSAKLLAPRIVAFGAAAAEAAELHEHRLQEARRAEPPREGKAAN